MLKTFAIMKTIPEQHLLKMFKFKINQITSFNIFKGGERSHIAHS